MNSQDKSKTTRLRTSIYGDRITVSLRLQPDLHRRLMELCNDAHTPANSYVCNLISEALKKAGR